MALAATAFSADPSLLEKARSALSARADLYCVIGGACTGKSTVCRALAEATEMALIDMDQRIYGGFSFDPARHPAVSAWFSADNPLAWMLSQSWPDFDALNRATNAEYLDLDRRMSETMVDESRALDIAVIAREPEMSITTLCDAVKARLGLRHRPTTT